MKTYIIFPEVNRAASSLEPKARLEEAVGLARAINLDIIGAEIVKIREVRPATYLTKGVLDRLKEGEAELLIIDASLSPVQQRNLEKELGLKVIDRTALILEIFGERANTKEGKLQVELAHLTYQRSRLVRSWTHLERQRGGAGFLGGPGETQIELDRRIIDDKIVKIKKELEKVKRTRELQRSSRKKVPYPIIALVGYTNAGKSTLFNKLTKSTVFAEDLLFATLDPTMRKIKLKTGAEIILSDTVGFISDLPHELVMSFRATLEEVLDADIIAHVRDISNPHTDIQKQDVIKVLHNLGLKEIETKENYIELLNKIDLLPVEEKTKAEELARRYPNLIATSAVTKEGNHLFLEKIAEILSLHHQITKLSVPASDGKTLSWIHENAEVLSSTTRGQTTSLEVKIDAVSLEKLRKTRHCSIKELTPSLRVT